jgi:hypothetical protein
MEVRINSVAARLTSEPAGAGEEPAYNLLHGDHAMASTTLIRVSEYLRTYGPDRDFLEGELKVRNKSEHTRW